MEINPIINEYVENRLCEIQDATGLKIILCSQSCGGILHACLSRNIGEELPLDDQNIEQVLREYLKVEFCYDGNLYFNLLPKDLNQLERKLKIQRILEE